MRAGAVIVGMAVIGIAGLMAYVWSSGGDCAGGTAIRSIEQCRQSGRSADICAELLMSANATLARSGPVSATREQCEDQFRTCQPSLTTAGYVPRATGFCLKPGATQHIVPLYGPR
jgi:uncharacterized protein YgiB involved in biofilm formation